MQQEENVHENDEDDDPVIQEMDVFLNKNPSDQIYILQFPTKLKDKPNDYRSYIGARVKPNQSKLELEIALDTHSENYSRTKGEQFALNVDGKHMNPLVGKKSTSSTQQQQQQQQQPTASRYYNSNVMDKQVYVSSNATPSQMNKSYQLGLIKDGAVHLTPVHSILQMRPNFEYFDIYEQKVKGLRDKSGADADYSTEEEMDAEVEKPELVTLKYSLKTPKQLQEQQIENEQQWVPVEFDNKDVDDLEKQIELTRERFLVCKNPTNKIEINATNETLLSKLIANDHNDDLSSFVIKKSDEPSSNIAQETSLTLPVVQPQATTQIEPQQPQQPQQQQQPPPPQKQQQPFIKIEPKLEKMDS